MNNKMNVPQMRGLAFQPCAPDAPWVATALRVYGMLLFALIPVAAGAMFLVERGIVWSLVTLELGWFKALLCFAAARALTNQTQATATLGELHRLAWEDATREKTKASRPPEEPAPTRVYDLTEK